MKNSVIKLFVVSLISFVLIVLAIGFFFFNSLNFARSKNETVSVSTLDGVMSVRFECKKNCTFFKRVDGKDEGFVITMNDTNLDGTPDNAVVDEEGRKTVLIEGVAKDKTILAVWDHALSVH